MTGRTCPEAHTSTASGWPHHPRRSRASADSSHFLPRWCVGRAGRGRYVRIGPEREPYRERRAMPFDTLDGDLAGMALDDVFGLVQPDPPAAFLCRAEG